MAVAKNAMEIFSLLDKSNCRKCGEKTCLAFAGAVFVGNRRIHQCPSIGQSDIERFTEKADPPNRKEDNQDEYISQLVQQVVEMDFSLVAERISAQLKGTMLSLPILGKNFGIHPDGNFLTDLHILPWVVVPVLDYVLHCKGLPISGDWISFREIAGGMEKYALFKKRGEDVLKHLADDYTDFFNDIVHMFNGQKVEKRFESDVSVVLYPLPLVPVMICYWKAEDGLESSLNLFFDKCVDDNLGVESTFFLGTGLAQMFQKLAEHHGF